MLELVEFVDLGVEISGDDELEPPQILIFRKDGILNFRLGPLELVLH